MFQRQREQTSLEVQALRLPLRGVQRGSGAGIDDFGDSPRDQLLAFLDFGGQTPQSAQHLPLQAVQRSPSGSPRDEFEDSPRDKVLAYLDGDDSASPWKPREVPQFPFLPPAPSPAGATSCHRGARRSRRRGLSSRRQDGGDSSGKETLGTDTTAAPSEEAPSAVATAVASEEEGEEVAMCSQPPGAESLAEAGVAAERPEPSTAASGDGGSSSDGSSTPSDWPDDATTVMLRNIPNRYTVEELIAEMLSAGFEGRFDFFYLPIDFNTKRNRGYAFINFREPGHARRFVGCFHGQRLTRYATQKILEVSPAITQGLDANIAQFVKKDAQRIQNPWFRPMIFNREGEDRALAEGAR